MDDKKEKTEKAAVINFLRNITEDNLEKLEDNNPIDIFCKTTGQKFQIKRVPADEIEIANVLNIRATFKNENFEGAKTKYGKMWSNLDPSKDPLEIYVVDPINEIFLHYGKNNLTLQNIILLLFVEQGFIIPMNKKYLETFKTNRKEFLKEAGFKEIYLLDSKNTIKIYHLIKKNNN